MKGFLHFTSSFIVFNQNDKKCNIKTCKMCQIWYKKKRNVILFSEKYESYSLESLHDIYKKIKCPTSPTVCMQVMSEKKVQIFLYIQLWEKTILSRSVISRNV